MILFAECPKKHSANKQVVMKVYGYLLAGALCSAASSLAKSMAHQRWLPSSDLDMAYTNPSGSRTQAGPQLPRYPPPAQAL